MDARNFWNVMDDLIESSPYGSAVQVCKVAKVSYRRFLYARQVGQYLKFNDAKKISRAMSINMNFLPMEREEYASSDNQVYEDDMFKSFVNASMEKRNLICSILERCNDDQCEAIYQMVNQMKRH